MSDQVPTRPSAKMGQNRLLTTGLAHYVNELEKAHEMVPLSRRTTEDVRSDDSSITQVSTDSQAGSDVPQDQNTTIKDPPAILGCNQQTAAPRVTLIKIGIIVRSPDGSIPRVIPLNPPQNVQSSEVLVKAALFYEEGRQGNSTCESHIFYNTQSGKVELNAGHFEQEYII
ncbi:uncharacterized protein LOC126576739 [Anopheles aquasalis]|uniref:uncharacterized protein LOC126576739 n=1 Tax=Anopheles aquasalis TaxID=42839 RepID=UPI00215A8832|nr:uncharacterized protein LOC126576739 [Anopheles aquasalis]